MTTINPDAHLQAVRTWLVDALNENAAWRELKAQDYPDDTRNARAAEALRSAASHVQQVTDSPALSRFAELDSACTEAGMMLTIYGSLPGQESQRVATRYFFDNLPGNPDSDSHERLLLELYAASLSDLRDWSFDTGLPLSTESSLAKLIGPGDADPSDAFVFTPDKAARITQLLNVAAALDRLAEAALQEADAAEGRLSGPRVPLARKQLRIALTALRALGGPTVEPAWKLIAEPPEFLSATRAQIHDALDRVNEALEHEAAAGE